MTLELDRVRRKLWDDLIRPVAEAVAAVAVTANAAAASASSVASTVADLAAVSRLPRTAPILGINQPTLPPHFVNVASAAPGNGTLYAVPLDQDPATYSIQFHVGTAFAAGTTGATGVFTTDVWPDKGDGSGPDYSGSPLRAPVTVTTTASGVQAGPTGIVITGRRTRVWVVMLWVQTGTPTTALAMSCMSSVVGNVLPAVAANPPAAGKGLAVASQTVLPTTGATPAWLPNGGNIPCPMGRRIV